MVVQLWVVLLPPAPPEPAVPSFEEVLLPQATTPSAHSTVRRARLPRRIRFMLKLLSRTLAPLAETKHPPECTSTLRSVATLSSRKRGARQRETLWGTRKLGCGFTETTSLRKTRPLPPPTCCVVSGARSSPLRLPLLPSPPSTRQGTGAPLTRQGTGAPSTRQRTGALSTRQGTGAPTSHLAPWRPGSCQAPWRSGSRELARLRSFGVGPALARLGGLLTAPKPMDGPVPARR